LRRELDARLNAARAWETEVESYYLQARGLGLLAGSEPHVAGWSLDKYILELRRVPALVKAMDIPDVQEGTNEAAAVELNHVVSDEDQLAQETGSIRRRLDKVEQLSTALDQYGGDLISQEDRCKVLAGSKRSCKIRTCAPLCCRTHRWERPPCRSANAGAGDDGTHSLCSPSAGQARPGTCGITG